MRHALLLLTLPLVPVQDSSVTPTGDAQRRPNILFAIADDWGWPHAGAYGDRVVQTPTFDRLAAEGALFEAAFVSSPSCTPSRNAILTGQAFFRLGEGANLWSTLAPEHAVYPLELADAGYHVGHWRKAWGPGNWRALGRERDPAGPRHESFEAFLDARPEGAPFCFWLGSSDPHRGYDPGSGERSGIDPAAVFLPPPYPDAAEIRSDVADYYFEVQRFDRDVGRALALLEERGELEDTLVVMTGDHGWPFPRGKTNLYDLGVRVPLAVRAGARLGGDFERGLRVSCPVSLTDLAPTFLEVADLDPLPHATGTSLLPLLQGEPCERTAVVLGRERHTPAQAEPSMAGYPARALRTERWLLVLNLEPDRWPAGVQQGATHPMAVHADCDDGPTKQWILQHREDPAGREAYQLCFGRRPAVELYDCVADPGQVRDLADDPACSEIAEDLRQQLVTRLVAIGDPRFTDAPVRFDGYPYRAGYMKQRLEKK
jgi:arylsulfatase A-like enzyme